MNENVKELLGVGRHDFWYYPGFALALGSFWVSSPVTVVMLLVLSTAFVMVFLLKSTPRYLKPGELHTGTRVFGMVGNVVLVVLQIVMVGFRVVRLMA